MCSSARRTWSLPRDLTTSLRVIAVSALVGLSLGISRNDGPTHPIPGIDATRASAAASLVTADLSPTERGRWLTFEVDRDERKVLTTATATTSREPDVFIVTVTLSPSGVPLRHSAPLNLTHSNTARERLEGQAGSVAVLSRWGSAGCAGWLAIDLAGQGSSTTAGWNRLERTEDALTNLRETGQSTGLRRVEIMLSKPQPTCRFEGGPDGPLLLSAGGRQWALNLSSSPWLKIVTSSDNSPTATVSEAAKGRPGHLAWAVDTVRDHPWVGPAKIAALEHYVFAVLDDVRKVESAAAPELDEAPELAAATSITPVARPETPGERWRLRGDVRPGRRWPPRPATPRWDPPRSGEGRWLPVTEQVKASDDDAVTFYQSWLRPDIDRPYAHVSVTAWDLSRVKLGVVAGTKEPISTTGHAGTGRIPRDPGLMPRLVAAFNGGFQTKHGEYGLVVRGTEVVGPAGNAATVAVDHSGRLLFGGWPAAGPASWHKLAPGVAIPASIESLRQNLEPLVVDGKVNPFRRKKWGSTAGKDVDKTHTTRTGICLIDEGVAAYFYGNSLSAQSLGDAMAAYGCQYGIHLDMNSGHSGFEFYKVSDEAGEHFEAARMIKNMWHMNFPRYIGTDARDFFYLTLRVTAAERLGDRTGLRWMRPASSGSEPVPGSAEPAEVLEAQLTLDDRTHLRLLRLPAAQVRVAFRQIRGESLAEVGEDATVAVPLLDQGHGVEASTVEELMAGAHAICGGEQAKGRQLVLARTPVDLFATVVSAASAAPLCRWIESSDLPVPVALNVPDNAALTLIFEGVDGREMAAPDAVVTAEVLTLSLSPAPAWGGRLEDLF